MSKEAGFQLAKISTNEFAILEDAFKGKAEVKINTNSKFGVDFNERVIACILEFQYLEGESVFIVLKMTSFYRMNDTLWNQIYNSDKKELVISKDLQMHLAVLSIGTARGIIHAKTEGTKFNQLPLPTINVTELIKKDETLQNKAK